MTQRSVGTAGGGRAQGPVDGSDDERSDDEGSEARSPADTEQFPADTGQSPGDPGWTQRVWYQSRVGIAVITADLLFTALLAAGTVVGYGGPLSALDRIADGIVPAYVYAFGLFGALGFVFTALIEEFDSSVGDVLRYNFRLPAAVPLGVGIYLLSGVILGEGTSDVPLVAGTVFLAGLYVNLAYKRLGALARRLLPGRRETAGS